MNIHGTHVVLSMVAIAIFSSLFIMNLPARRLDRIRADVRKDFPHIRSVESRTLHQWLSSRRSWEDSRESGELGSAANRPRIWDCRSDAEFAVSHLAGAEHVPMATGLVGLAAELDPETPVVVYCTLGYRASETAAQLHRLGFTNVYNLDGGIIQWANEQLPLVDRKAVPTDTVHPYNASNGALLTESRRAALPLRPALLSGDTPLLERIKVSSAMLLMVFLLTWETVLPAVRFLVPEGLRRGRRDTRLRHGCRNYFLGCVNSLVTVLAFVPVWWWAASVADAHRFGVLNWFTGGPAAHIVGAFLLLDLWTWTWHRINHALPVLWRFHRVHHSDVHLDVTSATRFHTGELVLSSVLRIPVIFLLGVHFGELVLYETLLFAVVQFHHANIRLPERLERWLGYAIVTPRIHRVHHSRRREETDSNFSSLLTLWDWLFGTFRDGKGVDSGKDGNHGLETAEPVARVGLDGFDGWERQSLGGLWRTPFV